MDIYDIDLANGGGDTRILPPSKTALAFDDELARQWALSYPYAIEHAGKLYVGYSNNGGGAGRVGEGRELWNNNSAELAVIPIKPCLTKEV